MSALSFEPVTVTRRYWTELCFIKLPTIAATPLVFALRRFGITPAARIRRARMLLHQVQHQLFSASMVLDLSGAMISAFYRRRASTLCREVRPSDFVEPMTPRNGKRPIPSATAKSTEASPKCPLWVKFLTAGTGSRRCSLIQDVRLARCQPRDRRSGATIVRRQFNHIEKVVPVLAGLLISGLMRSGSDKPQRQRLEPLQREAVGWATSCGRYLDRGHRNRSIRHPQPCTLSASRLTPYVCYGSKADIRTRKKHVRFSLKSGHARGTIDV